MSSNQQVIDMCENLWGITTKGNDSIPSGGGDSRPEGTYSKGFRDDIETWTHEQDGLVIRAQQIHWRKWDLFADKNGKDRIIEILKGGELLFKATEKDVVTSKNFGPEERYIDTTSTPLCPWGVDTGKIPSELGNVLA